MAPLTGLDAQALRDDLEVEVRPVAAYHIDEVAHVRGSDRVLKIASPSRSDLSTTRQAYEQARPLSEPLRAGQLQAQEPVFPAIHGIYGGQAGEPLVISMQRVLPVHDALTAMAVEHDVDGIKQTLDGVGTLYARLWDQHRLVDRKSVV